jgi:hypothetical protein
MRLVLFTISVGFLLCLQACAQDTATRHNGYTIDPAVNKAIKKKDISEGHASLDAEWIENDKPAIFPLSSTGMPCYAFYGVESDTTKIDIFSMFGTIGLRICLYKDSTWVFHFVSFRNRDSRTFKQHLDDKEYQFSPDAKAKKYKLVLTEELKIGEPIKGYVEFESVDFYQKTEAGDKKRNYNAKGYFRAKKLL